MGLLPPLRSSPCCITPVILIAALAQACPATFPGHVAILPFFQSLCTTQRVCTLTVASSLRFQTVFRPRFPRRLIAAECPIPLISEYLLLAPALRRTGDTLGTEPERTLSFHPARAIGSKAHRLMRMDNWTYGSWWSCTQGRATDVQSEHETAHHMLSSSHLLGLVLAPGVESSYRILSCAGALLLLTAGSRSS